MNTITPDYPLLALGLLLVLWARFAAPRHVFHILCQAVATFNAQYSLGLSLSLARLVPIVESTSGRRTSGGYTRWFLPFVAYAVVATLLMSQRWAIPPGVSPFYGEYRFVIQLVTFISFVLAGAGLSEVLRHPKAPLLLFDALTAINVLHGLASLYQVIANHTGLPLIGISRAHMGSVDVAAFEANGGATVLRPGGLAGEPKTVAVVFGAYLLVRAFATPERSMSPRRRFLETAALALASFGFLMAFSTSAFFGAGAAAVVLVVRHPGSARSALVRLSLVVAVAAAGWGATSDELGLVDLVRLRTVERVADEDSAVDPPVAAALDAIENDLSIAAFGAGLGGSSFIIMRYMGSFDLAYAPNISLVLSLVELGVFGTLLLLVPCALLIFRPLPPRHASTYQAARFYLALGVGTLVLQLAGSGIPMGFSLAIASLIAAATLAERGFSPEDGQ